MIKPKGGAVLHSDSRHDVFVRPATSVAGTVSLPGDKSISHRYAMLAAIAKGRTELENFSTGADCASTLACISCLGVTVHRNGSRVEIEGRGPKLRASDESLNCGNSGSTMRMLSGILAGQSFETELVGDSSLSRRPMRRIVEPLSSMGAVIVATDGHAPLRIRGGQLRGIEYRTPVASAQVKSAVLFAGLFADGETIVDEPLRTRDHTEIALRAFGASVKKARTRTVVTGNQRLTAIHTTVPGDISSAAFFLCAAALFRDSDVTIENVSLNPTRAGLLDVLMALGVDITVLQVEDRHGELAGSIHVRRGVIGGAKIEGATSALLIDELPVLAAIAPYTRDGIEIRDAKELRIKESDRIAAVAANLRAMGADVEEFEDGLRVPGNQALHGAELESFDDHRIAMAFAVAALGAKGDTVIRGADCARISFPEFFDVLDTIARR